MGRLTLRDDDGRALLTPYGMRMYCSTQATADCICRLEEALQAQGPVEPVPAIDDVGDWLCGNCYQSVVGEEELDASGFVPVKFNFCPNCGRAVKWE